LHDQGARASRFHIGKVIGSTPIFSTFAIRDFGLRIQNGQLLLILHPQLWILD